MIGTQLFWLESRHNDWNPAQNDRIPIVLPDPARIEPFWLSKSGKVTGFRSSESGDSDRTLLDSDTD